MTIVFLLEEKSMKYFLDGILPRLLPKDVNYITIPHEGKSDLQKSIPIKLRAWTSPNTKFVIVQDQDTGDCYRLKYELQNLCKGTNREVLIRIACHELEAWYFGDLDAISKVYNKKLDAIKKKSKYRIPDDIVNPKSELRKLVPEHQQILGAKKIAEVVDVEKNTSVSFRVFVEGVLRLCTS